MCKNTQEAGVAETVKPGQTIPSSSYATKDWEARENYRSPIL